ncbi:predicted protein [Sclerotinia sclerotiorum 1980 UF-70]|uniref:Uncharacterized protein n=1 Tax=Sclerotinia sclerotiorum (strain ATCC 18683 / 1980 / Ss-1) TaxID=665079 RepID=A7EKC0_SCLS1|nr:predicted protein [Sclerotinia sclerotiorum 1980 UF-70]EDO03286.1 predicted protein [Sclerotinia sclerotiorum 1980 UF-70]
MDYAKKVVDRTGNDVRAREHKYYNEKQELAKTRWDKPKGLSSNPIVGLNFTSQVPIVDRIELHRRRA